MERGEGHLSQRQTPAAGPVVGPQLAGPGAPNSPCDSEYSQLFAELSRTKAELSEALKTIDELTLAEKDLSGTVRRLTELASTDVLTGLSNRRRFTEALEANFALATRQDSSLSLVIIDVDNFKFYNDTFGHSAGDLVLSVVAKHLTSICRSFDVVARYGGEEFAILLPATDAAQAMDCAERHRAAIASYPWPLRQITASFGVSTLVRSTGNAEVLVEEADCALYQSKRNGRNCVTHSRTHGAAGATKGAKSVPQSSRTRPVRELPACAAAAGASTAAMPALKRNDFVSNANPGTRSTSQGVTEAPPVDEAPWDALDRFINELQNGKMIPDQYRTALGAVCEATGARVTFLCSEQTDVVLEMAGEHPLAPYECRDVTRWLAAELPRGGLCAIPEDAFGRPATNASPPTTAAVFRVETPRPAWLISLRFDGEPFLAADLRVMRVIWKLQTGQRRHSQVFDNLKETLFGVVRCLSTAIDAKDTYTCGHSERVARIAVRLGEEMNLSRGEISDLYLAGLLHDVGKIGIRDQVLHKEGPLTAEEYAHIKEHPVTGERIIQNVTRLAYLRPGVRGHHERFDGKGYPDGLAGEGIPKMARILAVADSCDAMMSTRRYRPALAQVKIEEVFRDGSGTQWDPQIVEHFMTCRNELYAVYQRGLGKSVYMAIERAAGVTADNGGPNPSSRTLAGTPR